MINSREKSVNVAKAVLLERLKANLTQHMTDYAEAVQGYKIKVESDLKKMLKIIRSTTPEALVQRNVSLTSTPPVSHEAEYKEIIEMLEMSVDEIINLDGPSFKSYVMNEWTWSRNFDMTTTLYKSIAASGRA